MSAVKVGATEQRLMTASTSSGGRRLRLLLMAPQPYFQQRGTPIAVRMLLDVLVSRGYDITLLTYPQGEDPPEAEYRIERVGRIPGIGPIRPGFSIPKVLLDAAMFRRARALCHGLRPDVVHAVEESVFIALALKRRYGVPYVYDMDSSLSQQMVEAYPFLGTTMPMLERMERAAIRGGMAVLAVCRSLQEHALSQAPGQLIARIEDVSLLDPRRSPGGGEDLKETTGRDEPIVLYVGNLERYQGVQLLLDGFRAMADRQPAQLVIIGGNRAHIEQHEREVRDWGLSDRIHFLGPRPMADLGWYLGQADVLASPRVTGTNTPMKIYSYLDSGTAVLATRLPTHTQVMDDRIACLVEPSADGVADGLVRLLSEPRLRTELACNAKQRVKQEYSRGAFERKVHTFYDEVEARLATQGRASR